MQFAPSQQAFETCDRSMPHYVLHDRYTLDEYKCGEQDSIGSAAAGAKVAYLAYAATALRLHGAIRSCELNRQGIRIVPCLSSV